MHKKSTDTVDRAMRELVELGAVVVQNRFDGGQRLTTLTSLWPLVVDGFIVVALSVVRAVADNRRARYRGCWYSHFPPSQSRSTS